MLGPEVRTCPDCGAYPGNVHFEGCDVARCKNCGHQALSCNEGDFGTIWTGEWPGDEEARELNLWCRWGPPWIPCESTHPDARPDLNRLAITTNLVWDRDREKWIKNAV